jgi:hypothetical protein
MEFSGLGGHPVRDEGGSEHYGAKFLPFAHFVLRGKDDLLILREGGDADEADMGLFFLIIGLRIWGLPKSGEHQCAKEGGETDERQEPKIEVHGWVGGYSTLIGASLDF